MEQEGVIKYQLFFAREALDISPALLKELNLAREQMMQNGLIGQDDARYDGYGFGNISLRCDETQTSQQNATKAIFFISGTQTGKLSDLDAKHLSKVSQIDPTHNKLYASGWVEPSSEAMTHGVLYQLDERCQAVIHVHSPDIWQLRHELNLPATPQEIPYGTPEMALAVQALASPLLENKRNILFCMDGHEDGVVAAGSSLHECSRLIINSLQAAKQLAKH
jgi:ribulose-5-phosphate 4-epimerase/fuculose-1-phosphate aldolase